MKGESMRMDLCCDIGEGFGPYRLADDAALLRFVSSANVACGFHAGDPLIMGRTVAMARDLGVAVGAHVGYPDIIGFGRRELPMTADELFHAILYQCGALSLVASAADSPMHHVSFHGNLGGTVGRDPDLCSRLMQAWRKLLPVPVVQGMPGMPVLDAAERAGLRTGRVFLVDRGYHQDGRLVSRQRPDAVLHDLDAIRANIRQFLQAGTVMSVEGVPLGMSAQTILLHSDTPNSVAVAEAVRQELEAAGWTVAAPM